MAYVYPTAVHSVSDSFADHVNRGSVNPGTDYTSAYGDAVVSVAAGTVTDASNDNGGGGGRTVHVDHDDGSGADYLHLASVAVSPGQWVGQGARLGSSGASGYGDDWYYGAHLHISFRRNHSHGYGNDGNVDFDAIMRDQSGDLPPAPSEQKEDIEMRIVQVPSGTIALVGEYTAKKYTSTTGGEGFSYQANIAAYGTSTGLTEDQVSTLANEASARRNALIADVANKVEAEIGASSSTMSARSMIWALAVGAVLIILAIVVAFVPGQPTTTATLTEFLIGAGAIVIGFALGGLRGGGAGRGRHVETEGESNPSE